MKLSTPIMKNWTDDYAPSDLILYESDHLIAFNKPPGINTQDDLTGDLSLLSWAEDHLKIRLHLTNRVDRPVSGVVLCTKTKVGLKLVSGPTKVTKSYIAITTPLNSEAAQLDHFIKKDGRTKKAYIAKVKKPGYKPCTLQYEVVRRLDNYHLIRIITLTGRFHQIRAQLAFIGGHIRGDVKYGARRSNKDRSIDLHAHTMNIASLNLDIVAPPLGRENIWKDLIPSETNS